VTAIVPLAETSTDGVNDCPLPGVLSIIAGAVQVEPPFVDFENDFRNFTTGPALPTTYSAITSSNGGSSWGAEIVLSTSDEQYAPVAGGLMIGDYEALAHSGNTFYTAFEVGNNASDPTDIDVASFTP
jgi:hypothetical protein